MKVIQMKVIKMKVKVKNEIESKKSDNEDKKSDNEDKKSDNEDKKSNNKEIERDSKSKKSDNEDKKSDNEEIESDNKEIESDNEEIESDNEEIKSDNEEIESDNEEIESDSEGENIFLKQEQELDRIYNIILTKYLENENETDDEFNKKDRVFNKNLNKIKLKKEELNRKDLEKNNNYSNLYPTKDDPNFNIKIAEKKEFNDTKYDGKILSINEQAEILCNSDFELAPHQMFVSNFMSVNTPYNSLLLYHGLGTGKTCSAITIAEEMREYFKHLGIKKKILIVASPNVQDNFKLQLFDPSKLESINGIWNIRSCTGNKFLKEVNPMNVKDIPKKDIIKKINNIIKDSYEFIGYVKLANKITELSTIDGSLSARKNKELIKRRIKNEFDNNLLVIDEIHNIRTATNDMEGSIENDTKKTKIILSQLEKLVENVDNMNYYYYQRHQCIIRVKK